MSSIRKPAPGSSKSTATKSAPTRRNAPTASTTRRPAPVVQRRSAPATAPTRRTSPSTKSTTRDEIPHRVKLAPKPKRASANSEPITPIKSKMTKSELVAHLVEQVGLEHVTAKEVKRVMGALEETILGSLVPKGAGEFTLHGLVVLKGIKKKAVKGGAKKISPFTGEEYIVKAKPAKIVVKARPLAKVRRAALGDI
jgi:nucleoid DNA-binding protein